MIPARKVYYMLLFSFIITITVFSCSKDTISETPPGSLRFSADTIFFDTIFTGTGSPTKHFKIYNPLKNSLRINSLYLAGGTDSPYRINVDGIAGHNFSDIDLGGGDSLFVFVEVTIDPFENQNPVIVQDSIVFISGGGIQAVKLVSWGQDVHVIRGMALDTQTLSASKPYLVYDYLKVKPDHVLTVEPGVRIYFHKNARLYVEGTIKALGTFEDPVIFQGSRTEAVYRNIPGQWEGIWLMPGSSNNMFVYSRIRNALNGIIADSLKHPEASVLYLENTRIENMTYSGLFARSSEIYSRNTVISNCGHHAIVINNEGNYQFYHNTIANYWNFSFRSSPSVMINNDTGNNTEPLSVIFGNSIIHGLLENEIRFSAHAGSDGDILFNHCLVNFRNADSFPLIFRNCIINTDPGFVDGKAQDFHLDENSPAIDAGDPETAVLHPFDFAGRSRINTAPDIGAFERVEDELQ